MARRGRRRTFLAGIAGTGLAGLASPVAVTAEGGFTLRFGVPIGAESAMGVVALHLASAVARRSRGQLTIEVYPNGQLAGERASVQQLIPGILDLTIQSAAIISPVVPSFQIFDMPFLIKDDRTAFRILEGQIGRDLFADLDRSGIEGLAWGTDNFRQFETTTKAVNVPDDMRGLRMRVSGGAVYAQTMSALGAIPITTIDASEALFAFQQRTIDGTNSTLNGFRTLKYDGPCKHVAMVNSVLSMTPLMASKRKMEQLPAPLQTIMREEARALVPMWRSVVSRQLGEDTELLKRNSVAFTNPSYAPFRRAVEPVYAAYESKLGMLIDIIRRSS